MIWSICLKQWFHCPKEEKLLHGACSLLWKVHMYFVPSIPTISTIPVRERECISWEWHWHNYWWAVTGTAELPSAVAVAIWDQSLMSGMKISQDFPLKSRGNYPSSHMHSLLDELWPWPIIYFSVSCFWLSRKMCYFIKQILWFFLAWKFWKTPGACCEYLEKKEIIYCLKYFRSRMTLLRTKVMSSAFASNDDIESI